VKKFAREQGGELMRLLRYTGFKTPSSFYMETTVFDRVFFREAVKSYEDDRAERDQKLMASIFGG